jgi:hypothetical protein
MVASETVDIRLREKCILVRLAAMLVSTAAGTRQKLVPE